MFPKATRREILFFLAAKAAALTLIYFVFFSPFEKPPLSPRGLAAHLLVATGDRNGHR